MAIVVAMKRLFLLFGMLVIGAPLTGCSTNPATGSQNFTAFMSPDDELEVGAKEHPKLVRQFGGRYPDASLDAYVDRLGQQLARRSDLPNLKYSFTILNDDKINAFALPGGYIHITRGLLAMAENESEVAGVLAHEIGHVTARHTAQRYSQAKAAQIGLTLLGVLGQVAGAPAGVSDLASVGADLYLKAFSRDQETEADTLGVRYMARSGFSAQGMTSFFRKLKAHGDLQSKLANKGAKAAHAFGSTHPRTEDRIVHAIKLAKINQDPNARIGRATYLDHIDGILFGDDPSQGVRRGRLFQHPDLRIEFKVPPGFHMSNTPTQVVAHGPDATTIAFDMVPPKETKNMGRLTDYLHDKYALQDVERITINGMNAATGSKRMSVKAGERDVRIVVIEDRPDRIYRLIFLTPPNVTAKHQTEFRRTTYSFRMLSAMEADAIKPLKIRLATVGEDDTIRTMAQRQLVERAPEDWFRLLNMVALEKPLKPGMQVKLVRD